ncbi:MAG: acetyltransferase [Minwuia sp.]|uniref:acetyltransferase n=1 Tax=Minwuia sp. TaxID=2493630 RepID=UPI003A872F7D
MSGASEIRAIAIVGSGSHARECIEAARAAGLGVDCLIDEDEARWGEERLGVEVARGGLDAVTGLDSATGLILAIGDNARRKAAAEKLAGARFARLVHPFSWISPSATIGEGAMIFAGCVVQTEARLGRHVILNTGATVSHDGEVGDFCHVAVGANLAGNVHVGEGGFLGAGVVARPGARIGAWATVGAGSSVIRDVPGGTTAFGDANARPR